MMWLWIIAYDLWNFAYDYNCVTDRAFYNAALLITCSIPAFTIRKGAWAQHRVLRTMVKSRKNPITDDLYSDHKYYQMVRNENI